jgi:hypothetical protein
MAITVFRWIFVLAICRCIAVVLQSIYIMASVFHLENRMLLPLNISAACQEVGFTSVSGLEFTTRSKRGICR